MNENLIEDIKKDINKTGFPLELRVASYLTNNSYYVAHSIFFVDEDEEKSREVDMRVLKNYIINKIDEKIAKAYVRNCFLIECKKSDKPWVFLCSPKNGYDPDYDKIPCIPERNFYDKIEKDILKGKHPFADYDLVGRSYYEAFKKTSENIFKAITTVVKSTSYFMENKFASTGNNNICYYYPIIIFEGNLFQGTLKNNEIEIEEVNSILLSFLYESKNRTKKNFMIPIINESEMPNFFKKLDDTLIFLGRLAESNLEKSFPKL